MRGLTRFVVAVGLAVAAPAVAADDPKAAAVAAKAKAVFAEFCLGCHAKSYFDARDHKSIVGGKDDEGKAYVVPGKPDESFLWRMMADDEARMPDTGSEERKRIKPADRDAVKAWILAGAPEFPKQDERKFIPLGQTLKAILGHAAAAGADAKSMRYFTLANLHNDNKHVTADDLRLARAAVSKAVNSLSWKEKVVVPEVVDADGTVLAVNIADLGWTADWWGAVAAAYPYHLGYDDHDDDKLKETDAAIQKLVDTKLAVAVRADWFVASATRPPLYHTLLYDRQLPALKARKDDPKAPANPKGMTAVDLEDFLGVRVIENLLAKKPDVMRAGFPTSGVSGENRLIERHPLGGGRAYWKSYDFKSSTWEANLQLFPLGPVFDKNPYPNEAFVHAGGEIIFHLKNGLMGYLLVDEKDRRIDAGPIEVVNDREKTTGTPLVVNGISCMSCHRDGTKAAPPDTVLTSKGVDGNARLRVKALYPTADVMKKQIEDDGKLFLKHQEQAVGGFLVDGGKGKPAADVAEPVGGVARKYFAAADDLDAATVATELHLDDAKKVIDKAAHSAVWRKLGLGGLALEGGRVKRGAWEAVRGTSQMQQAAREFGYSPR